MALQLWEAVKESITVYTGLSPATFFTVLALGLAIYYVVSGMFGSSDHGHRQRSRDFEEQVQPLPPPVQLGEISEEELKQYDGSDPKKPLLMAIKGQIYDISQSRMFYGPGGPYALFAGKDASRALAKMSFEEKDLTGDISGLGVFELEALQDWEYKFMSKYVKVGTIKKEAESISDDAPTATSSEPAVSNGDPADTTLEPEASSDEQAETSHQPAVSNGELIQTSREPAASNGKPGATSHEPAASNDESVVSSHEPAVIHGEPVLTSSEPSVTKSEPAAAIGEHTEATEIDGAKPAEDATSGTSHVKTIETTSGGDVIKE